MAEIETSVSSRSTSVRVHDVPSQGSEMVSHRPLALHERDGLPMKPGWQVPAATVSDSDIGQSALSSVIAAHSRPI